MAFDARDHRAAGARRGDHDVQQRQQDVVRRREFIEQQLVAVAFVEKSSRDDQGHGYGARQSASPHSAFV